jgi:O-antigen ligase
MHRLTFALLWLLVFSLPWELLVAVGPLGTGTRLIGLAAVGTGALTLIATGRLRRPGILVVLSLVFMGTTLLTLLWTITGAGTIQQVATYVQLLGLVWLVWQFAGGLEAQRALMFAYILGAYVSFVELFRNLAAGQTVAKHRYSASNFDPNDLGLTLAIGIPLAWYLFMNRRGLTRLLAAVYLPLAVVGILVTASRGGVVVGMIALSIVPLTMARRSLRTAVVMALLLCSTVIGAALFVPETSWKRVTTTQRELEDGTLSGRLTIWNAGASAFSERMLVGAGAGAFDRAVEPYIGPGNTAHNVFLAIAVEQGILGLVSFFALLAACALAVAGMSGVERKLWGVVGCVWLVGAMSLGWQFRKVTWLIVAMIAVQAAWSRFSKAIGPYGARPPLRPLRSSVRTSAGPPAAA